jgi:hypothetical protein
LVPHFVLQALEAEGIDQLIFHNTAVDAVLFAQGAKSGTQHFIEKLVDAESAVEYERLYDARSEYIHGRELKIPLTYDDLRKMRRLTRRVIVGVLELLQSHPSWTKREFIKHLHSL